MIEAELLAHGCVRTGPSPNSFSGFWKDIFDSLSVTTRTFFSYGKVMMEIGLL